MKKITSLIIAVLITAGLIGGTIYVFYARQKAVDASYKNAVALMHSSSYEAALTEFENANRNKFDRDDFLFEMSYGEIEKPYKNTVPLYSYALARINYENKDMSMTKICLDLISNSYQGELRKEIREFKEAFNKEYESYIMEKYLKEEQEKEEQKREEQKNKGQAKSSYSSSTYRTKKTYNDDTYDVEDYYDAEDFYDDHYDDFYDYEEAEDYYNENGSW